MKTPIITKDHTDLDLADELLHFTFRLTTVAGALLGIWALTALVSGLTSAGFAGTIRGYIAAITGF